MPNNSKVSKPVLADRQARSHADVPSFATTRNDGAVFPRPVSFRSLIHDLTSQIRCTLQSLEVWFAAVSPKEPGELEKRCEAAMHPLERQEVGRFRLPTSRNQHVVGRGMARTILASGVCDPCDIQFEFNGHGKPSVSAPKSVCRPFNIAHTEGMVLMATCQSGLVGVDVESLVRKPNLEIASRYFATEEVEFVMSKATADERFLAFLRVWTLKEAYIKAVGGGLSIPLGDFVFSEVDSESPRISFRKPMDGDEREWFFQRFELPGGFVGATAYAGDELTTAHGSRGQAIQPKCFASHISRA